MTKTNSKVDGYIRKAKWPEEMAKLREILLSCELTEEFKWGKPCYTFQESNVVIMVGFKEHCGLIFAKGALLKDPKGILIQPTENTQAARQMRFSSTREIIGMKPVIKAYLKDAIEVQRAGLEVKYKETSDYVVPEEVEKKLNSLPGLRTAFEELTPGRQRGYLIYFSAAKQAMTREARVEKCMPKILQGKGMHDE